MNPAFEIIPEAIFFQQTNLICEISLSSFSYIFENDIGKKIYGLYSFYFNKDEEVAERLRNIFEEQPLLSKNYKKVFLSFSGEESALLPEKLYRTIEHKALLDRLFGDLHDNIILTDLVPDKKIYNLYRIPSAIHKAVVDQFPLAAFNHQYSLLLKQDWGNGDLLNIIFYEHNFIAALIKSGNLQIINSYSYASDTDVIYNLKNICNQFDMHDVSLRIGGMVEINSDLDKELKHYFSNITFAEHPAGYEFNQKLKEMPYHYFSHLFSLASCV